MVSVAQEIMEDAADFDFVIDNQETGLRGWFEHIQVRSSGMFSAKT
jgi:hypothetical protein